jgi:hypothetical protein
MPVGGLGPLPDPAALRRGRVALSLTGPVSPWGLADAGLAFCHLHFGLRRLQRVPSARSGAGGRIERTRSPIRTLVTHQVAPSKPVAMLGRRLLGALNQFRLEQRVVGQSPQVPQVTLPRLQRARRPRYSEGKKGLETPLKKMLT